MRKGKRFWYALILIVVLVAGILFITLQDNIFGNRNQAGLGVAMNEVATGTAAGMNEIAMEPSVEQEAENKPPIVGLQTTHGEIVTYTYATMGTYSWEYRKGLTTEAVVACSSAPSEWEEIATIQMEKTDGTIEVCFADNMIEYTICYWIENATCGVADPVPMEGNTILLQGENAKGIYELHVVYEQGDAYYGFKVE